MAFRFLRKTVIGSILIKLKPQSEFKIPGRGEEALFEFFLDILKKKNAMRAEEIFSSRKEKPVTISPLLKGIKFSGGYSLFSPQETALIRVTYLKEDILETLLQGLFALASSGQPVSLADGRIIVKKIDVQKSAQAHFTTFESLLAHASEEERIVLEFCTPTSFTYPSEERILPLPNLVFTSVLEKWNSFSDRKLPDETGKEFEKIKIDWIRLKTEFVHYSWGKVSGFIGKVIYRLPESMGRETRRWVNALADFAFYSGVGENTFLGMGQARRREK